VVTAGAPDSLGLRLALPAEVESGASVRITLVVENLTGREMDLYLTGRPVAFDLVVTDETGVVVWRRLEGESIPMVLRIETLAPGASLELVHAWDQRTTDGDRVFPGLYSIRGELLTEDGPLATPSRPLRILSSTSP
jgi:hypothetical protein